MNLVKIATAVAVECERQQVGIDELQYLLSAYALLCEPYRFASIEGIAVMGKMVEPVKNRSGYRKTPVTFQDGGSSAPAREIPRLVSDLVAAIRDTPEEFWREHSDAFVKEFLWIHPFKDGNGRVGFLLYNYLNGTLDDPLPLPDYFGAS